LQSGTNKGNFYSPNVIISKCAIVHINNTLKTHKGRGCQDKASNSQAQALGDDSQSEHQ